MKTVLLSKVALNSGYKHLYNKLSIIIFVGFLSYGGFGLSQSIKVKPRSVYDCAYASRWDSVLFQLSNSNSNSDSKWNEGERDKIPEIYLEKIKSLIWLGKFKSAQLEIDSIESLQNPKFRNSSQEKTFELIQMLYDLEKKNFEKIIVSLTTPLKGVANGGVQESNIAGLTYYIIGKAYFGKLNYPEAINYLKLALKEIDKMSSRDFHLEIQIQLELGKSFLDSGQPLLALNTLENCRRLAKLVLYDSLPQHAKINLELGWLHNKYGRLRLALNSYKIAEDYYSNYGTSEAENSDLFYRYGLAYQSTDPVRAIGYFSKILEIYENSELKKTKPSMIPATLSSLALTYEMEKDYENAIIYLRQALKIFKNSLPSRHPSISRVYMNLGRMFSLNNQEDSATFYHKKSLKGFSYWASIDSAILILPNYSIAESYNQFHKNGLAISHYKNTVSLIKSSGNQDEFHLMRSLLRLAKLEIDQSNLEAANNYLGIAQNVLEANDIEVESKEENKMNLTDTESSSLISFIHLKASLIAKEANNTNSSAGLAKSLNIYQDAIRRIDSSKTLYQDKNTQYGFIEDVSKIYDEAMELALELYDKEQEISYLSTAFTIGQKKKGTAILANLNKLDGFNSTISPQEKETLETLEETIAQAEDQINYFESENDSLAAEQTKKQRFQAQKTYDSLKYDLEQNNPAFARAKYNTQVASLSEVQKGLATSETLIEYFRTDTALYAFGVNQEDATFQKLALPKDFDRELEDFLRSSQIEPLSEQKFREYYAQTAHRFYQTLLQPLLDSLKAVPHEGKSKLIIVPDGKLGYLPFDALLTAMPEDVYDYKSYPFLMKEYSIRSAFSATLMQVLKNKEVQEKELMAAFAPSYMNKESWLSGIKGASGESCEAPDEEKFRELMQAGLELDKILEHINGVRFDSVFASEAQFKAIANQYRVLHLNMHGFTNDCDPMYSGLAFTPRTMLQKNAAFHDPNPTNEGILHAYEIYNMRINAELVVMSACQTGLGKIQAGEGIMSLARAFAHAGSPNTVMSLWQVDEAATRKLMTNFYKYLGEGEGKDEALQLAKLDYLNNNAEAHPFYWAGFVLVGDDKPIVEDSWLQTYWWMILLGVSILIGSFLILRRYSSPARA